MKKNVASIILPSTFHWNSSSSKLVVFPRVQNSHNLRSSTNHRTKRECSPNVFQKLACTKHARAASRSIREISSASGSTYAPLPDFDVWSMPGNGWGLLLRRSNAGVVKSRQRWKGGPSSSATRRQSSLLTPQSRFSRCKDRSECQITARQRRQRRLFLLSLRRRVLLIN